MTLMCALLAVRLMRFACCARYIMSPSRNAYIEALIVTSLHAVLPVRLMHFACCARWIKKQTRTYTENVTATVMQAVLALRLMCFEASLCTFNYDLCPRRSQRRCHDELCVALCIHYAQLDLSSSANTMIKLC